MATNDELKKGKELLKDTINEVGFLDNAFKSLAATISTVLEDAIDNMAGLDDVTQKVAKSYQRDIEGSIKKTVSSLEDTISLQKKINAGQNVEAELKKKMEAADTRKEATLKRIEMVSSELGVNAEELKKKLEGQYNIEQKLLKGLMKENEERQKGKSLLQIAKENAGSIADKIDKSGTLSKVLSGGIGSVLTPMRLLELGVVGVFEAMVAVDKLNGELAKNLNISVSEASKLSTELLNVANQSGSINITTKGLGEALMAVNGELGIFNTTIDDNLILFQELKKTAGLTYEELNGIKSITDATGGDLEKNTKELLAQSRLTGQKFGVALNEKEVLKDISNVSKTTTLSLGMSTKELAKAVSTTKALGMEMSKVEGIADSLLNFESSIEKELEAELLLGKNINLEKARQAALNNDIAGVAEEIAKQAGSAADFGKMNRIQQEALAGAVGMSREELAKSLFIQEQIGNLTGDEYEVRKKQIEELEGKGLSQKQIAAELGKQSIDDLKNQQSIQENLNNSIAKMKEGFVSIAAPLMQIITPIVDLLIPAVELLSYLFVPITTALTGMAKMINLNFESLTGMQTVLGAIAIIWAGIVAKKKISAAMSSGEVVLRGIRLAQTKLQNREDLKGLALGKSKLIQLASQAALWALANPIPALMGLGVAAAVGAVAYNYTKGNDIMSPGENTSGYGKRTLMGPEGAIALNNKDTVIAGTNLFPKEGGTSTSQTIIQQDNTEAKKTNALLSKLINKPDPVIQMNGDNLGTAVGKYAYSIQ
jgi:transcriptional regulator with XRE-family HTH domain